MFHSLRKIPATETTLTISALERLYSKHFLRPLKRPKTYLLLQCSSLQFALLNWFSDHCSFKKLIASESRDEFCVGFESDPRREFTLTSPADRWRTVAIKWFKQKALSQWPRLLL